MRELFLQRPVGAAQLLADAVRLVGLISAVVVAIGWGPVKGALLALALLGLVLPRMLGVRAGFDIAVGVVILAAAWTSVLDLYVTAMWTDIPAHLVLSGLLAALSVVCGRHAGLALGAGAAHPVAESVLVTGSVGALLSVLWEVGEWAGHTYLDPSIFVGYDDTILDLSLGVLGSAIAGLFLPWITAERRTPGQRTAQ